MSTGRNLLVKRDAIKPYHYPELLEYKDAIRHAYWIHTEYNLTPDVQDFKVSIDDKERNTITRFVLGVSQIEVSIKRFWGKLYDLLPQFEIDAVGATFADSEVRHFDAYSHILDILGLSELFEQIEDIPAIRDRYAYLEKVLKKETNTPDEVAVKIILFAEIMERTSLFGSFYGIMSFNRKRQQFKGLSNIVEATSKEEEIHGQFGVELYNILKEENPYIGNSTFIEETIITIFDKAVVAEEKILDWVFSEGDLDHLTKAEVKNFVLGRFNQAMEDMGLEHRYETDPALDAENLWFYEELKAPKEKDFFNKRVTDYSKGTKSITRADLF